MVGKWSVKNPLTIEERRKIKEGLDLNLTYKEIAEYLGTGRHRSTIRKECARLGGFENYDPEKAQEHFERLQLESRKKMSVTAKTSR
jgi:IS30 family transposase